MKYIPTSADPIWGGMGGATKARREVLEVIMLRLCVYYHGVLRYTIVADMEKARALREQGFYVLIKPVA